MSTAPETRPASGTGSSPSPRTDWRPVLFLIAALVVVVDRVTKIEVQRHIQEGLGITVIPHVFQLTHVLNNGAAFSLFQTLPPNPTRWALTSFSLLAAVAVAVLLLRIGRRCSATAVGLALVLGGSLGNAWDRLQYASVTDFLAVYIYHYHWPDFNVADSAIVVGGILIFLGVLFTPQQQKSS